MIVVHRIMPGQQLAKLIDLSESFPITFELPDASRTLV